MPCDCIAIDCIEIFLIPCAVSVTLPILADETGTWKMVVDFNGGATRTDVAVLDGESIVAPNVFNENYTHKVTFYRADNTIFNCYKFKIMATVFTNPPDVPTSITIADVVGLQPALNTINTQIQALIATDESILDDLANLQAQIDALDGASTLLVTATSTEERLINSWFATHTTKMIVGDNTSYLSGEFSQTNTDITWTNDMVFKIGRQYLFVS